MAGDLGTAIIGLAGALIGSGISTGATILLAVRKEKSEANLLTISEARELMIAARLFESELAYARATIAVILKSKSYFTEEYMLSTVAWETNKTIFAKATADDDWLILTRAGESMHDYNILTRAGTRRSFDDGDDQALANMLKNIEKARLLCLIKGARREGDAS